MKLKDKFTFICNQYFRETHTIFLPSTKQTVIKMKFQPKWDDGLEGSIRLLDMKGGTILAPTTWTEILYCLSEWGVRPELLERELDKRIERMIHLYKMNLLKLESQLETEWFRKVVDNASKSYETLSSYPGYSNKPKGLVVYEGGKSE